MIQGLAIEIIVDIGMWCALDHILGEGSVRSQADRRLDLHRVFKSLLQAAAESNAPAVTLSRV